MDTPSTTFENYVTSLSNSLPPQTDIIDQFYLDRMPSNSNSPQSTTTQILESFVSTSSGLKNKTGNGLKSKNSNKRQCATPLGSLVDDVVIPKRLKLDIQNSGINKKVELLAKRLEEDAKEFVARNLPRQTSTSALSSSDSSASSSSSASPTPILAPPWQSVQEPEFSTTLEIPKKLPPPIVDLATPEVITVEGTPPPLAEIQDEPVVVDLSQTDQVDIHMLYKDFCQMFPNTPKLYLEQQAADLVGKHVAINRFIDELFANDSKPPEYWKPDILPIWDSPPVPVLNRLTDVTEKVDPNTQTSPGLGQDHVAKKNDLTIPVSNDTNPQMQTASFDNSDGSYSEKLKSSDGDNSSLYNPLNENVLSTTNETPQYDNPVPGPSGTQRNIQGQKESSTAKFHVPIVGPSKIPVQHKPDIIELENAIEPSTSSNSEGQGTINTEITDTEEERREQQMDKRVQNLLSLFPQKDPEFLRAKNNEFGLDVAGVTSFETWVLEVVENGGKDLPSREDYDKRKKVVYICSLIYHNNHIAWAKVGGDN